MEMDKRVEGLESELKLMKGEVKQTLAGVRDYLVNLKLPASPEAALLAAAIRGGGSDVTMDGKLLFDKGDSRDAPAGKGDKGDSRGAPPEKGDKEAATGDADDTGPAEPELSQEEEKPMEEGNSGPALSESVPPVNLLANLIRWVASAKREVGAEQLTTFLEVYGISGHLSQELKEIILHLADITEAVDAGDSAMAEKWSQLMLELHGILAGTAPLRPAAVLWSGGDGSRQREKGKPKKKPTRLKLVLSGDDGKDKEFSLDLKPSEE